jgi:hypothetical protein
VATIRGAREACADALDFSRRSAIACARQQLVDVLRRDITPIAHIPSTFRDCQVFIRENSIYAQTKRMTVLNQSCLENRHGEVVRAVTLEPSAERASEEISDFPSKMVDVTGIEPVTPCLQSRRRRSNNSINYF